MGVRSRLLHNATARLQYGESLVAVFPAQTINQYLAFISKWIVAATNARRVVVVTNQRILVCYGGRFRDGKIKGTIHVLRRDTTIGPTSGLWYRTSALGEPLYVRRRFHKDIARADGAA